MPADLAVARALARREQQRRAAADVLDDFEEQFAAAVAAAFASVFAPVLQRFASAIVADAAGFASPDDLNTIRADWAAEVDHTLAPLVSTMYDTGALSALLSQPSAVAARRTDSALDLLDDVLDRNAAAHLEAATNRLVAVGDTAWAAARESLVDGFTIGEDIDALAARVAESLEVAEARAVTIARTEVISASNAGSAAGVRALGSYGPARKQWLSTVDSRTRESHMDADGQEVGIDEPFVVGGYDLDYPGDPAGPADEVINCRCTLIYPEPDVASPIDDDGRGQGGPDPLSSDELEPVAASAQEHPMSRAARRAVRTTSGFVVPPPPPRSAHFAEGDPVVEEEPVVEPEVVDDALPEDVVIEVAAGVNLRPFEAIVAVEGRWTGDQRFVLPNAVRWDGMLPSPLTVNHDGTVESVIGFYGECSRIPGPGEGEHLIVARGFLDLGPDDAPNEAARFVEDRIEAGSLSGTSMELDDITLGGVDPSSVSDEEDAWWMDVVEDARLRALTVCPTGAFAECRISLDPEGVDVVNLPPAPSNGGAVAVPTAGADPVDDEPAPELEAVAVVAAGISLVAGAIGPDAPPAAWFEDPQLAGPTPLTVTDDGRVFGHLATWGTCHTGFQGQCITAPRSASGYAAFRTGEVRCADGSRVATGRLTVGTGHASTQLAAAPAAAHYDNTGAAVADVAGGEDAHGIWLAGAVRPGATADQVQIMRASPPSGDWRRLGTGLELVAALHVNVPGFPVPRSRVASGVPQALVAAGQVTEATAARAHDPKLEAVAERLAASIGRGRPAVVASLAARVHPEEN